MNKKECHKCKKAIDLKKDLHVTLGTHEGERVMDMAYFHFNCWRLHFEEKTREKATVITNAMQEKMMPIAKQLTEKLKDAIGNGGSPTYNIN